MMAPAAKENSKSSFAVTCGLLSRYLRENKGGALQGLPGLDIATPVAAAGGGDAGAFQPPTTMNLLSGLEEPKPDTVDVELAVDKGQLLEAPTGNQDARDEYAQQLTIFYSGKVVVVDNFPSTEVKALLQMANAAGDIAVDKADSNSSAIPQSLPGPAHNNLSDVPIARRNSLHRFLEKRKGRITAKAPYQGNNTSATPSKKANGDNTWLGLRQEVAIKQEI